jgi:hypothetical protein
VSLTATNDGIDLNLTTWLANWSPPYIKLFKNNHTPAAGDTPSDYTEAVLTGDSGHHLTEGYTGPADDGAGRRQVTWPMIVFTATGSGTANDVYGYYVHDVGANKVLWAERLASPPFTVNAAGLSVAVTPKYTRKSEF